MSAAAQMEPALILHVRPYQESSAIVQMLTLGQGRLAGVLRGYRSKKNGQVALQPFSVGTVSWVGRNDLVTIQKFESHHFIALQGDALYAGFYVLELLTRLLRERAQDPQIFAAAMRVLEALEEDDPLQPTLRTFELDLLQQLGYGVDFSVQGQPLDDSVQYYFEAQSGFHAVQDASRQRSRQYSGLVLNQIAARSFSAPETQDAAKALMRAALSPLLGDKPLTSRKMFQR
jgi:DNA repair protein RecO (recombination protein O)